MDKTLPCSSAMTSSSHDEDHGNNLESYTEVDNSNFVNREKINREIGIHNNMAGTSSNLVENNGNNTLIYMMRQMMEQISNVNKEIKQTSKKSRQ